MKNKRVLLFLSQGFEEYEAGVFTDVIGWSRELGKEPVYMISTALRAEIKCKWNLIVRPEVEFDKIDINDYDALAIPGGFSFHLTAFGLCKNSVVRCTISSGQFGYQ